MSGLRGVDAPQPCIDVCIWGPADWVDAASYESERSRAAVDREGEQSLAGCFAGWRSPRRVRAVGAKLRAFTRKRGSLCDQGNHAVLRTRRPSGRLKPMDSAAALLAPGIRSPSPRPASSGQMSRNSHGLCPGTCLTPSAPRGSERDRTPARRPRTATMLRDVRYDLADGGEYVAEGAHLPRGRSAEPDERNAPSSGRLRFDAVTACEQIGGVTGHAEFSLRPWASAAGTGRAAGGVTAPIRLSAVMSGYCARRSLRWSRAPSLLSMRTGEATVHVLRGRVRLSAGTCLGRAVR